ncbi:hypothetical protein [Nostoc sp. CALU 546]|uniref:hypothetical protein n=1 Tax=Nostoc sp. CALU 546 TaxID=1867241 RepID=UPI003B67DD6E
MLTHTVVRCATPRLEALVALYPKCFEKGDRTPNYFAKSRSDRLTQKALIYGQMLRVRKIASLFVKQLTGISVLNQNVE